MQPPFCSYRNHFHSTLDVIRPACRRASLIELTIMDSKPRKRRSYSHRIISWMALSALQLMASLLSRPNWQPALPRLRWRKERDHEGIRQIRRPQVASLHGILTLGH
jgi:hypothetical protein